MSYLISGRHDDDVGHTGHVGKVEGSVREDRYISLSNRMRDGKVCVSGGVDMMRCVYTHDVKG